MLCFLKQPLRCSLCNLAFHKSLPNKVKFSVVGTEMQFIWHCALKFQLTTVVCENRMQIFYHCHLQAGRIWQTIKIKKCTKKLLVCHKKLWNFFTLIDGLLTELKVATYNILAQVRDFSNFKWIFESASYFRFMWKVIFFLMHILHVWGQNINGF